MAASDEDKEKPSLETKQRLSNGQFTKANKAAVGAKGNNNNKARALQSVLFNAVGTKELIPIIEKMIEQAQAGDKDARKECLDRLWGKAKQSIELGGNQELPAIRVEIVRESKPIEVKE